MPARPIESHTSRLLFHPKLKTEDPFVEFHGKLEIRHLEVRLIKPGNESSRWLICCHSQWLFALGQNNRYHYFEIVIFKTLSINFFCSQQRGHLIGLLFVFCGCAPHTFDSFVFVTGAFTLISVTIKAEITFPFGTDFM